MSTISPERRRVADFVGRTWVFDAVNKWLETPDSPLFFLAGPQGSGKSTFATRLEQISRGEVPPVGSRIRKEFLTYSHFCSAKTDTKTLFPNRFIESLSAAIVQRNEGVEEYLTQHLSHELRITLSPTVMVNGGEVQAGSTIKNLDLTINIGDTSPLIHFDTLVRKPLEHARPADPSQPMVILIDALDEALTLDSDTTILDLLRDFRKLPSHIRWVITSRSDPPILEVLGRPNLELTGDENRKDLYAFAYETLPEFAEPLRASRAKAISEKENFLYARSLLEDEKLVAELRDEKKELSLPEGLTELYRASLLKHGLNPNKTSWLERYRPVFGAIVASFGQGLTAAQLASVTGRPRSEVDTSLTVCRRFCKETQQDGPFQIYDTSFKEFLRSDQKYRVYAGEANEKIAGFFYSTNTGTWLTSEDRYALKYLPLHFLTGIQNKTAGPTSKQILLQLLTDLTFIGQATKAGNLDALVEAMRSTQNVAVGSDGADKAMLPGLIDVLQKEKFILNTWSKAALKKTLAIQDSFFWQQVRNRAFGLRLPDLVGSAEKVLQQIGRPYLREHWPTTASSGGPLAMILWAFQTDKSVSALAVSADGQRVAAGFGSGAIQLYDFASGNMYGAVSTDTTNILAVAFVADHLYSVSEEGWISSWKIETLEQIQRTKLSGAPLKAAAIAAAAAHFVAYTKAGEMILGSLDNLSEPQSLGTDTRASGRLALSNDGQYVVSTDGKTIVTIWNVKAESKDDLELPALASSGILDQVLGFFTARIDPAFLRDDNYLLLTQASQAGSRLHLYNFERRTIMKGTYSHRALSRSTELKSGVLAYVRDWLHLNVTGKHGDEDAATAYIGVWVEQLVTTPDGAHIIVGDRQGGVRAFQYVP
jgi:hypothetical protein